MHYELHHQLAQARQADLMREADRHRLAQLARAGSVKRRGRVALFLAQIRRQRPQQRPVPVA